MKMITILYKPKISQKSDIMICSNIDLIEKSKARQGQDGSTEEVILEVNFKERSDWLDGNIGERG